jgi:hypothetical protein
MLRNPMEVTLTRRSCHGNCSPVLDDTPGSNPGTREADTRKGYVQHLSRASKSSLISILPVDHSTENVREALVSFIACQYHT